MKCFEKQTKTMDEEGGWYTFKSIQWVNYSKTNDKNDTWTSVDVDVCQLGKINQPEESIKFKKFIAKYSR